MTVERERPVTSMTSVRVTARPSRISRRTPPGEPDTDRGKVVIAVERLPSTGNFC